MTVVVAVPARLESSRLPGKVLADIAGRPMLAWVLERCRAARSAQAVFCCSDSPAVLALARQQGVIALATPHPCQSGSERLAQALPAILQHLGDPPPAQTLVINVQADQPFLDPALIDALAAHWQQRAPQPAVLTPVVRLDQERLHDPSVVKALLRRDGEALAFSRSAIPHLRGVDPAHWAARWPYWGHVGVYAYRADVLARWPQLPPSPLEAIEQLEQWRLLEAGISIHTLEVSQDPLAVDTPAQLEQARRLQPPA